MKYAGDSAIFRDFNLFITHRLFKKSVLDSAEMRCLVVWSLKEREDSTFGKSQTEQKLFLRFCVAKSRVDSALDSALESMVDSADSSPSISLVFFRKRATPPSPLPLRAKSRRFSLLGGVPRNSVSSKKSAGGTSAPLIPDFLHHETGEFLVLRTTLFLMRFCFAESASLGKLKFKGGEDSTFGESQK